jgi:hypothetical protein
VLVSDHGTTSTRGYGGSMGGGCLGKAQSS